MQARPISQIVELFFAGKLTRDEACKRLEEAKAPCRIVAYIREGPDLNLDGALTLVNGDDVSE